MKGILLCGGNGSRLYPANVVSKQLLTVFDKPMIYFPLALLLEAGISEILFISTKSAIPVFKNIFGDGSKLGLKLSYEIQEKPNGIAEAFIIGADFIGDDSVTLVLGDNLFYGLNLSKYVKSYEKTSLKGAQIFAYKVSNPVDYGVVEFNNKGKALSLEEKPKIPKSDYAIPGVYIYDNTVVQRTRKLKPSKRGELEITDLNLSYLNDNRLFVNKIKSGVAWLDSGSAVNLKEASNFVAILQQRLGQSLACLEEIVYRKGFIKLKQLRLLIDKMPLCEYRKYLEHFYSTKIKK